ncbi:MAG: DUF3596 domain-containing protein [Cyanobacteria bacterium J06656_5]
MKSGNSRSRRKAKTGSVKVRNSNNRLQLVFTLAGKRHFVSLGLADTPLNRKLAQDKAFEMQPIIGIADLNRTRFGFSPASTIARFHSRSCLQTTNLG